MPLCPSGAGLHLHLVHFVCNISEAVPGLMKPADDVNDLLFIRPSTVRFAAGFCAATSPRRLHQTCERCKSADDCCPLVAERIRIFGRSEFDDLNAVILKALSDHALEV